MSDENKSNRPLSEISHLFLTSLREQAGENRNKPVRIPPGQRRPTSPHATANEPIDLSPEEFAHMEGKSQSPFIDDSINAGDVQDAQRKRVTAIVGPQLGGQLHESVLAFAASLTAEGQRIGLLTLDSSEFKLQLIDTEESESGEETEVSDVFDSRRMSDSILELNHDVDRWLLVFSDPRRPEARQMLRLVDDWTMLATCDHDGIVSGYRALKGLAENEKLPLSIALIDAPSESQAEKVFNKLASVCRQFLDWDVTHTTLVGDVEHAQAHTILWCHAHRDKGQLATAPQWRVVQEFLELAPDADADVAHYGEEVDATPAVANQPMSVPEIARPLEASVEAPVQLDEPARQAQTVKLVRPEMQEAPAMQNPIPMTYSAATPVADELGEVIELPEGASILAAVLKSGTQLLATPITAPMCSGATVAVGRDRGLVLVAQAGEGLAGMESIAAAVAWLDASKQLIAMAMPQLSIDSSVETRVQLLIDHNDRAAEGIRPLLGNSRITIRSYRKLRWAGRTGLLLDAA
jgi:hypothetical protein